MVLTKRRGPRSHLGSAAIVVTSCATVVMFAAGCSSSSKSSSSSAQVATPASSSAASPTTTAPVAATVMMGTGKTGPVLTDRAGMTLYTFDKDTPGAATSACTAACATRWPALTVTGTPTAGPGVPGQLTAVGSTSGGSQVAWNGKLLYYFSGDHAVGDTNGDGVGGVWHVVTPTASSAPTTTMLVGGY